MATKAAKENNVVQIKPTKKLESEKKWGKAVMKGGFCVVPSLLLRAQQRLGLSPTQLAIILQLADFWWEKERPPWPSKSALSDRLGICPKQIQRNIAELETAGLVKRIARASVQGGRLSNMYDLSGLVEKLKALEPEFTEVREESKHRNRQIKRRGGIRAEPTSKK